jgi:dTDP-4-dehydrorhamnose reductase
MKILLLGARGMLGTDLLPILAGKHEVVGKDIEHFDLTNSERVQEEIACSRPAVVINAAAYTDVDGCESHRDLAFAVNAEGARNVARACSRSETAMIHFSTDYVFDGRSPIPYEEDAPPHPLNVYGKSKLQGEHYIQEILGNYLIIRTAWLYGAHGKNFVDTILRLAAQKDELRVVNDQRGAPTFTKDLARAVDAVVSRGIQGILHVINSGSCTWFEFARKILEIKKPLNDRLRVVPISSKELARPAPRPANSVLDCTRFGRLTGETMRPWDIALKEYLGET